MNITTAFQSPGYTYAPPGSTLESRMGVPVCSRDGLLQHDEIMGYFPGVASAWQPKLAPKDIDGVKVRYRYLDITPAPTIRACSWSKARSPLSGR